MTESKFTAALRKELKDKIYVLKLSVAYSRGVPDCYYSGSQCDLWNEHKYLPKLPPTIDPTKLLTKMQQLWLEGRCREGRHVAVIIGSSEGHVLLHGLRWQTPIDREDFRARMKNKKELAEEITKFCGPVAGDILP